MIDRRMFLKSTAVLGGAAALSRIPAFARSAEKLTLSVPITHSDWMLKPNIPWGPAGVRHMLDACKQCGWSQIYWRVFDGGRAMYPSKLARPGDRWDDDSFWSPATDEDRKLVAQYTVGVTEARKKEVLEKCAVMDYSKFDALKEAVDYGHSIGLKIHAWVSINEDDHGWGLASDFAKAHPECRWVRRDGRRYHSQMSFAFPDVREYKLSLLKELLAYDLDGLFLDWIRTGDVRDNPQTDAEGVADSGYESPNLDAFKQKYVADPHDLLNGDDRWVRLRAEPQTLFMRGVKKLVAGRVPVSVLVGHPWHYRGFNNKIDGNLRGLLLDLKTWADDGLIDAAVPAGYYRDGGNMEKAYQALKQETDGKIDVWTYGWVPQTVAAFEADVASTRRVDANHLLLWEGDYIDDRPNAAELKKAMRATAIL